jgi:hypothetical protein
MRKFTLCLVLFIAGCGESREHIRYKDRVHITDGFYAGYEGVVLADVGEYIGVKYDVQLNEGSVVKVKAHEMEKIDVYF